MAAGRAPGAPRPPLAPPERPIGIVDRSAMASWTAPRSPRVAARARREAVPALLSPCRPFSWSQPVVLPRVVTFTYLVYLALPLALLVLGAQSRGGFGATSTAGTSLLGEPAFRLAFLSGLQVTLLTCLGCLLIGLPLVQGLRRLSRPVMTVLAPVLALVPVTVPPLLLTYGYVRALSAESLPWVGSIPVLVAAHVGLALPYFVQTLLADSERQQLGYLEEVAESLGAGRGQRFFQVVLPGLKRALLGGLMIVAALSIGEQQFANLVTGLMDGMVAGFLLTAFHAALGYSAAAVVVLAGLGIFAGLIHLLGDLLAHLADQTWAFIVRLASRPALAWRLARRWFASLTPPQLSLPSLGLPRPRFDPPRRAAPRDGAGLPR